jgi:hypothetical protein
MVAAPRALAGGGGNLDQVSVEINQEMGPAEVRYQAEGAAEPLCEHYFCFRGPVSKE